MDFMMEHKEAKSIVKDTGWDGFLETFQEKYMEHDLYSCSTYWVNDSNYICKFRGVRGDITVGWKGVHDK